MTDGLYSRLCEYVNSDFYPFHMPGHKRNVDQEFMSRWYSMDITEINGFDNLHRPQGILLSSQQKAAGLYHADETYFLVNGSTCGILSALSAVMEKGKKLVLSRNSHISAYHCAGLHDMELEYLYPAVNRDFFLAEGIGAEEVERRMEGRSDVGAVMITSPTYEGVVSDIAGIARVVHQYGVPLIVDQAHGAHFGFHPAYPENAVRQGADLVVHSLHKTLPAPTQTALLHVNGERIDRNRLQYYLRVFQTSSPSYPLMAGIDCCLDFLQSKGTEMLNDFLRLRMDFVSRLETCRYIKIGGMVDDPFKVLISGNQNLLSGVPLSGNRLAALLRDQYHLEMEMITEYYVLALFSFMDTSEGMDRLARALCEIDSKMEKGRPDTGQAPDYRCHPLQSEMGIKKALESGTVMLPLEKAIDRIAGDFIFPYPPGIPAAVPGERLDRAVLEIINGLTANGIAIHGLSHNRDICVINSK